MFAQFMIVSVFNVIYIEYYNIDTWSSVSELNLYDLSPFEDSYFASFFYYNIYSFGLLCAWLVKNNIKPKFIVSLNLIFKNF